ncbi:MAG TPA: universal stress protein [Dehalococcoidia bacterium]|nr:universal stress protein [Dehalococcoidia bacterium]
MAATRILVPLDGSELSDAVIPYAESLAQKLGGELVLVMVGEVAETSKQFNEEMNELTQALEKRAERVSVPHRVHAVPAGDPVDGILQALNEEDADYIVMSTHGRSGLSDLVQGSVASGVVRRAKVPVLLKRPDAAAVEAKKS